MIVRPSYVAQPSRLCGSGHRLEACATTRRRGLSLVEVLASLAIFLLSLVALSQLIEMGADRARDSSYLNLATAIAQSNMDKVLAGILPVTGQGETASDEDPDFNFAIDATGEGPVGLYLVTVTVSRNRPDGTRFETKLSQYVLDPTLRGSTTGTDADTTDTTGGTGGGGG
jgi:prepilin-type N-terminal cleavage/methylation domain-containing protein